MSAETSEKNLKNLAAQLYAAFIEEKRLSEGEKILICPLKRNGAIDFAGYEKLLGKTNYSFPLYEKREIEPENRESATCEVRRIVTPASDVKVPNIRYIVLFDDSIKTGKTMIGALAWLLENKEELGFDKVYVAASWDRVGISHFCAEPSYIKWHGPVDFMYNGAPEKDLRPFPKTYKKLEKSGLLSAIGDLAVHYNPNVNGPSDATSGQVDPFKTYKKIKGG